MANANFYLDISVVGVANEYQAWASAMTIGALATDRPRPMDGNGKAQSPTAAAVAIAELQITTLPSDGNTLSIGGSAAITAKTTVAAKNQFAIGANIAAATTNLISLLNTFGTANNQCDVTASTSVSQAALAIPYLYWARLKPGTTDTIQLFTRVAGDDFNTAKNTTSKITQTGTWLNSGAASINFSEGVDGPAAYFINNATIFGKAAGAYGLRVMKSPASVDPAASTDYIWSRTKRSGSNLTCPFSLSTASYLAAPASRQFIFDAGNTWAGDSGSFTLAVSFTASTAFALDVVASSNVSCEAEAAGGFTVTGTSTVAGSTLNINQRANSSGRIRYTNAVFQELNTNVAIWIYGADSSWTRLKDCWFKFLSSHALFTSAFGVMAWLLEGGGVEYSGLSADVPTLVTFNSTQTNIHLRMKDFTCKDTGGVWKVTTPMTGLSSLTTSSFVNAEFENVSGFRAPSFGFNAYGGARPMLSGYYQSADGDRPFRFENQLFTADFMDDGTFPNAGAQLPSGNYWSMRCTWLTSISRDAECTPFTRHFFNRSSTAVKTIKLNMLCSDTVTPKTGDLYMTVSYKDNTGVRRIERTACVLREDITGTDAALATGDATWTYNGLTGYSPKMLTLTTAYPVQINTSVTVSLTLCGTPSANTSIYVHPDVGIA